MRKIERLKREARESAAVRGHRLGKFTTLYPLRTSGVDEKLKRLRPRIAVAYCVGCNAYVQVDAHPSPNGIDIGGDIFASTCFER